MAFFCKRKVSKSKRKTIGCKGCKYYEKVFGIIIGNGDVLANFC